MNPRRRHHTSAFHGARVSTLWATVVALSRQRGSAVVLIAPLLATALAGACSSKTGGGTDCEKACSATTSCPSSATMDCATQCSQLEAIATGSGCTAELDALLSCENSASDPCGGCNTLFADYDNCISHFCTQNPMPGCP
jgi:hypothetical protein